MRRMHCKAFSRLLLGFFFLLFSLIVPPARAQNLLTDQDLSTIDVDRLSDNQVRQLVSQAQASGVSEAQLEAQALQRGMPQTQLDKLKGRIQALQGRSGSSGSPGLNDIAGRGVNASRLLSGNNAGRFSKNDSLNGIYNRVFDPIRVKVFGEEIFNNANLTFEPDLRIATPKNYSLGPEDELVIDIYGYSEATYRLKVTPEGYIRVPDFGPIAVSGLSIEQAKARIFKELSKIYSGMKGGHPVTFLQVTLGNIRSIKVTLIGEVKLPGTYTLPSLATPFNALYSSGGPSKNGSFRNIELIRNSKVVARIDIYDFLLKGDLRQNIRLEDQDVIKINPYSARVEWVGEVKRTGIFEIKPGENLSKVLAYAGGFTDRAYTHRIKVIRSDGNERTVSDVADINFDRFYPERADQFFAGPIIDRFQNRVQILGEVFRPGFYALTEGLTAGELIRKADGITNGAFTSRASIARLREDNTPEILSFDVNNVLAGKDADIALKREDVISVYSKQALHERYYVSIDGEVNHPDSVSWSERLTIEDLVLIAGGFKDAASFKKIEIVRRKKDSDPFSKDSPIAEVFHYDLSGELSSNPAITGFVLQPFDRVFIRSLPGYTAQQFATVEGEIAYHGTFGINKKQEHISDLIQLAGGLTAQAFPDGATLIRHSRHDRFDEIIESAHLSNLLNRRSDSLAAIRNLRNDQIRSFEPVGIDLMKAIKSPGSKYDLILMDGDTIRIPKKLETVRVRGQVLYPVKIRYDKSYTLKRYIREAGGFSANAAKGRTYVVYANGSARSTGNFLFFKTFPRLRPGAEIFVPERGVRNRVTGAEILGFSTGIASLAALLITIIKL